MLNGVAPIVLFYFYNEAQDLLDGFPVPIYLDERIIGMGQVKESKAMSFEFKWVGEKFFTKTSANGVTLSYVGGDKSTGIIMLINYLDKIVRKLNLVDREKIGYKISYFSPTVIISNGYISSYSQSTSSSGNRIDLEFTIERALKEEAAKVLSKLPVSNDLNAVLTAGVGA